MTHTPSMETTTSEATTSIVMLMPNSVKDETPANETRNRVLGILYNKLCCVTQCYASAKLHSVHRAGWSTLLLW